MDIRREARALQEGCHVVVGTPGRLRDHLERDRLDASALRAVVLDEADEMLDLGFREDLEFILDATPPERRTLLFSATIPRDIANLARRFQRNALRIDTVDKTQQHIDIEYRALNIAPGDTERAVVNVLRFFEARGAMIFCHTREAVRHLHAALGERGFSAVALSGELSQAERTHALSSLREGRARVCVATDVAARGIDLPDLGLVVHADLPGDRETLLHRSGRTGRAGRKGVCVVLVPYTRRRKAESVLSQAGVMARWSDPPSADDIRAADQRRLMEDPILAESASDDELVVARLLLEQKSPEEIAAAFVRLHRARLPAPEELFEADTKSARPRRERVERDMRERPSSDRPHSDRPRPERTYAPRANDDRPQRDFAARERQRPARERATMDGERPDRRSSEGMVEFKMSVGRKHNADPKWLLPVICRLGAVSKKDVGAIRIHDRETRVDIVASSAEKFAAAIKNSVGEENIRIEPSAGAGPMDDQPAVRKSEFKKPDYKKSEYKKPGFKQGDFKKPGDKGAGPKVGPKAGFKPYKKKSAD
jgi:ATP-dependent RNA helicase DeaD